MISAIYDIAMLGNSRAGKTSYMRAMYGKLQHPHNGFTLKANQDSEHQDLLQDYARLRHGNYPNLSALRERYNFTLSHHDKAVVQFNWIDHRGGAMLEKGNVVDAATLREDLRKVSAVLLFCDAHALATGHDDKVRADRMCSLITNALVDAQSAKAVIILFSKADLIPGFTEEMLEPFAGLCDAIGVSECVNGMIVPVACGQKNFQVEIPALFALHHLVATGAEMERQAELSHKKSADDWRQTAIKRGWWGKVEDFFSQVPSDDAMADAQEEEARNRAMKYTSIISSAKSLNHYLSSTCRIRSGQTAATYAAELGQHLQSMRSQSYISDWS